MTKSLRCLPKDRWPYVVPDNWIWTTFEDVADILNGYAFKSSNYTDTGIRVIRIANVQDGYIEDEKPVFYPDEIVDEIKKYLLYEGDLLISLTGNVGRVAIMTKELLPAALNQRVGCIRIKNSVPLKKELLYLYMLREEFQNLCIKNSKGIAQLNMSTEWLKKQPIPIPPYEEQNRIVQAINYFYSKLDDAENNALAVAENHSMRKLAILHYAFSGQLSYEWRQHHVENYNVSVLENVLNSTNSWSNKDKKLLLAEQEKASEVVVEGGQKWIKCTIGAVAKVCNGSTPSRKNESYWNGDIPWISSGEVKNNIIGYTNESISEEGYNNTSISLLPKGTVLIAMIGEGKTRGQSAILDIEATINQNIAAIIIDHGYIHPKYLWYWLQMNYSKNREKGTGSGPQALNCQRVRELEFIVPSYEEQTEIVNQLDLLILKEDDSKEAADNVVNNIKAVKSAVVAQIFRGELNTNKKEEKSVIQ